MVSNGFVLQTDHLDRKDIYVESYAIESSRMAKDLIYRLLFARDVSELRHHIEGLVGTHDDGGATGLLMDTYASNLSRRGKEVLKSVAALHLCPGFRDNEERRRLVYHYVMFTVLLTEQPFCDYVQRASADADALRQFLALGLGPLLEQLLTGNMATTRGQSTRVDLIDFVSQARVLYCYYCTPRLDLP